MLKAIMQGR